MFGYGIDMETEDGYGINTPEKPSDKNARYILNRISREMVK